MLISIKLEILLQSNLHNKNNYIWYFCSDKYIKIIIYFTMETTQQYKGRHIGSGFKKTLFVMADESKNLVFIVKKHGLRIFDIKSKTKIKINEEDWSKSTAACYGDGYLYICNDGGNIYKIATQKEARAVRISKGWTELKYMMYYGGTLYLFATHLWKMDPNTGKYLSESNVEHGETRCAWVSDTGCWLASRYLSRGDLSTSEFVRMNEDDWRNTKCLYSTGNIVYAVCKELYVIQGDGKYEKVYVDWGSGEKSFDGNSLLGICGCNKKLYGIWDSGKLWEIDL